MLISLYENVKLNLKYGDGSHEPVFVHDQPIGLWQIVVLVLGDWCRCTVGKRLCPISLEEGQRSCSMATYHRHGNTPLAARHWRESSSTICSACMCVYVRTVSFELKDFWFRCLARMFTFLTVTVIGQSWRSREEEPLVTVVGATSIYGFLVALATDWITGNSCRFCHRQNYSRWQE